jgi:hypothetical protein
MSLPNQFYDELLENQIKEDNAEGKGLNSAFMYDNPDFDPSKDVPKARGCDTSIDIIANR